LPNSISQYAYADDLVTMHACKYWQTVEEVLFKDMIDSYDTFTQVAKNVLYSFYVQLLNQ